MIQCQKHSVYLFSGSYESVMNKLFVSSKAPFYKMVKIIQPGFIEEKSLLRIIETVKPYKGPEIKGVNISRGIRDLSGKGLIYSGDSSYHLTDPLFEKYIRDRILKLDN